MRLAGLLLLGWLYVLDASADQLVRQHLHEIRTRSALLCASALLHFNPHREAQDARALASSYDSLNLLATRAVQLGQPEPLATQLHDMQRLFKDLERLPRGEAATYPQLLGQLLQRQRDVDAWAAEQMAKLGTPQPVTARQLRWRSLAMAQLLLAYQARGYPFASPYTGLAAGEREALDRDLNTAFGTADGVDAAAQATLASVRKGYRFVRSQLLASRPRPTSGGVEFYVARGVIDLDELAALADGSVAP